METQVARKAVDQFRAPKKTLGNLDAEAAAKLIAAAADIALIVDNKGIIRDVAFGSDDLSKEGYGTWLGQRWIDTVTVESRVKIEEMLRDAAGKLIPRSRQVNHPSRQGPDVPVRYSAIQVGGSGRVVAVGRDLRVIASMQQRLVDAQQSMEREYVRVRHAETRYRLLFQIAAEPVLVVDAATDKVTEANPAALEMLGKAAKKVSGRSFSDLFTSESVKAIQAHFAAVRAAGRSEQVAVRLADDDRDFFVSASMFRQETTSNYLVRLIPKSGTAAATSKENAQSKLLDVIEKLPDGFVVTDQYLRILTANSAFLELAQIASEEQVRGEPLDRWLGRHGVDVNVLMTNVRDSGVIRNFATVIRGEYGSTEDVEISAVSVANNDLPCIGITIRNVGRRPRMILNGHRDVPRSVEQLTELVGRVSLKDLVRDSTDLIERLCIEAALELTGDNRASAAEMLGLSRQGLYSKLRRYGLGDLESD